MGGRERELGSGTGPAMAGFVPLAYQIVGLKGIQLQNKCDKGLAHTVSFLYLVPTAGITNGSCSSLPLSLNTACDPAVDGHSQTFRDGVASGMRLHVKAGFSDMSRNVTVGLRLGLRVANSSKFPRDLDAAGHRATLSSSLESRNPKHCAHK